MANNQKLSKLLELASQRLRHHHDALWEEEKHYTWWVYVILGVVIFIYVNQFSVVGYKILLIVIVSLFGIFISWMGYTVVRREGEFFYEAFQVYKHTAVALGLNQPVPHPNGGKPIPLMPQTDIQDFVDVKSKANKSFRELITSVFKKEFGIRDCFQLTFVISAVLFIFFCIFSVLTLN